MTGYMYRFVIDGKSIPTSYVETNDFGERISYNDSYCTTTGKQRCGIGFKKEMCIRDRTSTIRDKPHLTRACCYKLSRKRNLCLRLFKNLGVLTCTTTTCLHYF